MVDSWDGEHGKTTCECIPILFEIVEAFVASILCSVRHTRVDTPSMREGMGFAARLSTRHALCTAKTGSSARAPRFSPMNKSVTSVISEKIQHILSQSVSTPLHPETRSVPSVSAASRSCAPVYRNLPEATSTARALGDTDPARSARETRSGTIALYAFLRICVTSAVSQTSKLATH